jgi:hypothetical protein
MARDHDLAVLHTSTPSFASDVKVAERLKAENPSLKVGLIGAKVAVQAEESLRDAPVVDFVARNEFDFTVKEVAEGRDFAASRACPGARRDGALVHNRSGRCWRTWTRCPSSRPSTAATWTTRSTSSAT